MSDTARDLISASLRTIGVLAAGETLGASEATDGLASLNRMIDSWSIEKLLIPNTVREVFPLVPGQKTYTMGVGGNFNTSRPTRIESVLIQLTSNSPMVEIPMHLLNDDQYAGILIKDLTSTFPLYCYPEGTSPLETFNFWPVPNQADNVVVNSSKPLSQLATISSALSVPPGYEECMIYNLAIRLAPEYGRQVSEVIAALAIETKANIKRINWKPDYLRVDDALLAKPSVFNWMTGEPT